MRKFWVILAITATIFAAGCFENTKQTEQSETGNEKNVQPAEDPLITRGLEITSQVQQVLAGKLQQTIQDSGISVALRYCQINAYPLTDSLSKLHGVEISRVSSKNRNPGNKTTLDEGLLMQKLVEKKAAGEPLEPVIVEDATAKTYYAPIVISAPLCLKCHGIAGEDIATADFIMINMLYPNDLATGFKLGDVRGLWKVRFPKEAI